MRTPDCNDHQHLMLDLARGRLDDQDAARAEEIRRDCPLCRAWWEAAFRGPAHAAVDAEVAAALALFQAPRRRSMRALWAVAAAAVVVLAVAGTTMLGPGQPTTTAEVAPISRAVDDSISTFDFESGAVSAKGDEDSAALFAADFESGGVRGWVPST